MIEILTPRFVEVIPERLDEGVLYVCEKHRTALHRCCCGCGREVVTPLGPAGWSLRRQGGAVTLHPSIGNWGSPCQSHYWIRRNNIVWSGAVSKHEIDLVRRRDQKDKAAHIERVNRDRDLHAERALAKPTSTGHSRAPIQWMSDVFATWWKRFMGKS